MGASADKGGKNKGGKGAKGKMKPGGGYGAAAAAPDDLPADLPKSLRVQVPNGIPDQKKCTGQYEVVTGLFANGKPVWKHKKDERWLYHGTDDLWYIGDKDEYDADFDVCEGYIRSPENAKNCMPHEEASGRWERFNTKNDTWNKDGSIVVAAQP